MSLIFCARSNTAALLRGVCFSGLLALLHLVPTPAWAAPSVSPPYDDVPVLVCRLVVVESASSLVDRGAQMSEDVLAEKLKSWSEKGQGEVVVDEGFLLPVGGGIIGPHFDSAGGQPVAGGNAAAREPGLSLAIGATQQGTQYTMQSALSIWNLAGQSLKESLAVIRQLRSPFMEQSPAALAALSKSQPGPETKLQWESRLQQATVLTSQKTTGSRFHHAVFVVPVAGRPAMVAQPGQPRRYGGAVLREVEGKVPTAIFWRVINHVRPDLARPADFSGRLLDMFWPDEKWELFAKTMEQAGGRFTEAPTVTLNQANPSHRMVSSATVVAWTLGSPLPTTRFAVEIEDPLALASAGGAPPLRLCESHHQRWTLFARPMGDMTHVVAVRSQFEEGTEAPPKAMAVVEEGQATPSAPSAVRSAGAPARSPLDLYVGEWTGSIKGQPASRVKMICNWNTAGTELLRDSRVVLDPEKSAPVFSSMVMKFDELSGKFHSQIVAKGNEASSVAEGSYDAATRTFIWRAVNDLTGATMVTRASFPSEGVMDWSQTITDREGQLISQGGGKNMRQHR